MHRCNACPYELALCLQFRICMATGERIELGREGIDIL